MYISEEYIKESAIETFAHHAVKKTLGAAGLGSKAKQTMRRSKKNLPIMQKTQGKMELKAQEALKAGDKKTAQKYQQASKNLQKKHKKLKRSRRVVQVKRGGAVTLGLAASGGQGGQ